MSRLNTKKTCTEECHKKRLSKLTGRAVFGEKLAAGTTGAMSELCVAVDLMKKGYAVFRALSPACFCDLIAIKDGKSLNVEVKTGYLYSVTSRISFQANIRKGAHIYGIYERNSGNVVYLDADRQEVIIKKD